MWSKRMNGGVVPWADRERRSCYDILTTGRPVDWLQRSDDEDKDAEECCVHVKLHHDMRGILRGWTRIINLLQQRKQQTALKKKFWERNRSRAPMLSRDFPTFSKSQFRHAIVSHNVGIPCREGEMPMDKRDPFHVFGRASPTQDGVIKRNSNALATTLSTCQVPGTVTR